MSNLRKELNYALDVFDSFQIPEEKQKEIIFKGVTAIVSIFNYGDIRYPFNAIEFARFIDYYQHEWLDNFGDKFDVNKFLEKKNHTLLSQPLQIFFYEHGMTVIDVNSKNSGKNVAK